MEFTRQELVLGHRLLKPEVSRHGRIWGTIIVQLTLVILIFNRGIAQQ